VHEPEGNRELHDQDGPTQNEWGSQAHSLRDDPTRDRTREHCDTRDYLTPAEDRFQIAGEVGCGQSVNQPCFDRAGEEREAEADQDRDDPPESERRLGLPQVRLTPEL
jgi:hypothetical protein